MEQTEPAPQVNRARQTDASGRDLFRGLFFGRGPVAQALPEIWNDCDSGGPAPETHMSSDDIAERIQKETERLASEGLSREMTERFFSFAEQLKEQQRSAEEMNAALKEDMDSTARRATDEELSKLMDVIESRDPEFFERFRQEITSGDVWAVSKIIDESTVSILNSVAEAYQVVDAKIPGVGLVLDRASSVWLYETIAVARDYAAVVHVAAVGNHVVFWSRGNFGDHSDVLRREMYMKIITERMAGF
ncbi:hypothetical protein HPC49_26905 [Pyxidicoccus fallax]|uniref:Uncharacterized protein n=1 Tax=Pyxidicoccus fallax TaxID=394095 RepID=A0A848LHF1_9BACT|nr:hypothetical protein [Pyxidicoccus fallax]NMO15878.1 hypothetical protein [Pyxidicoccus fallax]NPC81835.1 hypothetical protein [Pyxidicoccus fallax]